MKWIPNDWIQHTTAIYVGWDEDERFESIQSMAAPTNSQYSELTNIYPRTGCLPALLLNYFAFVNSESSSHVNSMIQYKQVSPHKDGDKYCQSQSNKKSKLIAFNQPYYSQHTTCIDDSMKRNCSMT